MAVFVSYFLVVLASLLAIPVSMFFLEIVAGLIVPARETALRSRKDFSQRVAILVPAHNEGAGLRLTLENIKAQLITGDRLLVVADNCADDTAAVATAAGAEVIVRNDPTKGGKGFAMDFGLKHLSLDPPAIVIVIDADCRIAEGSIDRLAATCAATCRPVQALYLMAAPDESPISYHVAEFAWRVKNWVRPSGLHALNLPCQLMGTGMAFPWELIRSANLAHGSTVEDVKLGLDLTQAGSPPLFCPSAEVKSHFPWSVEGARSQRKRWEEGHIRMILTAVPRLLYNAIRRRNLDLLTLTLDLVVPPLSLLVILVAGMFFATGSAAIPGFSSTALFISAGCLTALIVAVFLSWLRHGRDVLPPNKVFSIASYIFAKLPLYRQVLALRTAPLWIRTDRTDTRVIPAQSAAQPPIDS
jgi:cellulose synthase/poly-beta-1,6-N-acetylglucosamine synthase-like glycosyltransferase